MANPLFSPGPDAGRKELCHGCVLEVPTNSLQLRDPKNQLRVNFTASITMKVPHKHWVVGHHPPWRTLAVEGPQNVPWEIKLLWKRDALPEAWASLSETLGQALSRAAFWQQLGLTASLSIPSHDNICITFHSACQTSLPPDVLLPTSTVQGIHWALDFTPYPQAKFAHLQLQHIQPLVDDCINLFLNDKLGAPHITGGFLTPSISQKNKVASMSNVVEEAVDLHEIIKSQIYHQILRAFQGTRPRKKLKFTSSSSSSSSISTNELLSQPLEKFHDLFGRARSLLSQEGDTDDEGTVDAETTEFEDIFEDESNDDNYSDFEDLFQEAQDALKSNRGHEEMTPDSPTAPAMLYPGFDIILEHSDSDFTMLDDSLVTSVSAHAYNNNLNDSFSDFESPPPTHPSSVQIENRLGSAPDEGPPALQVTKKGREWEEESILMMMF
ncbi:hypothetical protein DRE_04858 [Drechslerella stenobrocha 248]|uniref:Uncharacterized protein n=1 Tax=Drechslerella stenobrocha 248 TaxID=1043628 RepID=W7HP28_9PEZI|nr:hypothetical protein DRE_04858 [Drechslerella stenobrocha 248]